MSEPDPPPPDQQRLGLAIRQALALADVTQEQLAEQVARIDL